MTQENPRSCSIGPAISCVVLLSGGIDSAACLDFYRRQQFVVSGFHVTYGQAAAHREEAAARAIANHYQIPLTIVTLDGTYSKSDGEIRGRNAFLIFTALMELEAINPTVLALGIHSSTSYYDCSPGFLYAIQALVDGQYDGCFRVAAPFLDWTKSEIWAYCIKHRIPLDLTYSCERGLDQPCGLCLSCRDLELLHAL